jgi:hypothetical protein
VLPKRTNHEAGSSRPVGKEASEMRVYTTQHLHYCGVDLHARSLFVNVLDHTGTTRLEQDLPASPQAFLDDCDSPLSLSKS